MRATAQQSECRSHQSTSACRGSGVSHRTIVFRQRRGNSIFISVALFLYIISDGSLSSILNAGKILALNQKTGVPRVRPLLGPAYASPVPEPSSARARSAHRLPPINGSIFGKRSLETLATRFDKNAADRLFKLEEELHQRQLDSNQEYQKTESPNYQDIITEIIEDFMALNNDSDPEEASVSFCRMIVYECTQMLSSRSKPTNVSGSKLKSRT